MATVGCKLDKFVCSVAAAQAESLPLSDIEAMRNLPSQACY